MNPAEFLDRRLQTRTLAALGVAASVPEADAVGHCQKAIAAWLAKFDAETDQINRGLALPMAANVK